MTAITMDQMNRGGAVLIFFLLVVWVDGHGRLLKPPARSSLWRFGYDTPINYEDHQLYCGGRAHQIAQGGRCGICGDPYDEPQPRTNEIGGPVYGGHIVAEYQAGAVIDVKVEITANHRGFIQFKICPVPGLHTEATQHCLDQTVLRTADSGQTKIPIKPWHRDVRARLQLPPNLSCQHCVIQWRYHAGNSWGRCEDGSHARGCGSQEEFYGCSDVSVGYPSGAGFGTGSSQPSRTQTEVAKKANKFVPRRTSPRRPALPTTPRRRVTCVSVGLLSRVPGMDGWCQANCNNSPPYCPPEHCRC